MLGQDERLAVLLHLDLPGVEFFRGRAVEAEQLVRRHHQLRLLPRRSEPVALRQAES